jgi:hypothetical protein
VEHTERNEFVLVRIGRRMIAVLPDREVNMGEVDPEAEVAVTRRFGPDGLIVDIEAKPPASATVTAPLPAA